MFTSTRIKLILAYIHIQDKTYARNLEVATYISLDLALHEEKHSSHYLSASNHYLKLNVTD